MKKSRRKTIRITSFLVALVVALVALSTVSTVKYMKTEKAIIGIIEEAIE